MNKKFITKNIDTKLAVKDIDAKEGIVTGYFAAFGNTDAHGDVIMPGAFKKSIEENGPSPSGKDRIQHLRNHNTDDLVGKIFTLEEDSIGLYFESKMSKSSLGRDTLQLYDEGILREHSIGFITIQERQDEVSNTNRITEIKLFEGSAVTWGANENTPVVDVKSFNKEGAIEQLDAILKGLRSGRYTDETFRKLEIQAEQLKTYIHSLNESPSDTQEEKGSNIDIDAIINSINKL